MAVAAGGTHRVPESTPTISATDDSTRVKCPAEGSTGPGGEPGHIETYSPPGPNLHAGSIRPILCVFILDILTFRRFLIPVLPCFFYRRRPRKSPNKTRTNLRQKETFLRNPILPVVPRSYMGPMTKKKMCSSPGVDQPNSLLFSRRDAETQGITLPGRSPHA
jgi:hypothetical protein